MDAVFKFYDSIGESLNDPQTTYMYRMDVIQPDFGGPRNYKESREYFRRGADEAELKEARRILNDIDVHIHGIEGEVWTPQPYGAYPIVPEYLSGDPMCMRTKTWQETDLSPIRIVLDVSVVCTADMTTIARRAAAVTAFAMKLSERRPVEVWIAMAAHNEETEKDVGFRIRMDSPVNISQVMAAYNASVCRVLGINLFENLSSHSRTQASNAAFRMELKGVSVYRRAAYVKVFRDYLQLDTNDLLISCSDDSDMYLIDRNAVEWVKNMLIKYGFDAEENE